MIDFIADGRFSNQNINNIPILYKAKNPALQQGLHTSFLVKFLGLMWIVAG